MIILKMRHISIHWTEGKLTTNGHGTGKCDSPKFTFKFKFEKKFGHDLNFSIDDPILFDDLSIQERKEIALKFKSSIREELDKITQKTLTNIKFS